MKDIFFLRTAKTGSSSIAQWCMRHETHITNNMIPLDKGENSGLKEKLQEKKYYVFTLVRNPFTSAISCWQQAIASAWIERECSFEKFLDLDFQGFESEHARTHLIPLTEYLYSVLDKIQFIIRLENLENCLRSLCEQLKIEYHQPGHVYSGGYNKKEFLNKYLNPLNKKKIEKKYKSDFEYFGY